MGKRGPDPKPKNELRRHHFGVNFSDLELDKILSNVFPDGVPDKITNQGLKRRVSAHIRNCVLNKIPPRIPEVNREAWAQLARAAANLNQYQKAVNEGMVPPEKFNLSSLYKEVQGLRNDLLGIKDWDNEGED